MDFFKILNGGIGVSMSNFDRLWAKKYSGWPETELTGLLPLSFLSKGEALTDYRIYGTESGAGVQTENLFDKTTSYIGYYLQYTTGNLVGSPNSDASEYIDVSDLSNIVIVLERTDALYSTAKREYLLYDENKEILSYDFYVVENVMKVILSVDVTNVHFIRFDYDKSYNEIMLVPGSTAPATYIPPGYKIPILNTSGVTENLFDVSQATPVTSYRFMAYTFQCKPNTTYTMSQAYKKMLQIDIYADATKTELLFRAYNTYSYTFNSGEHNSLFFRTDQTTADDDFRDSGIMLIEGSTAPDHYIPHRYTSNYDLFIGDSKLSEDEYVDYGEQKVWKKPTPTIYGWHVDPSISNPAQAITYLGDAVGKTPAAMGASTFSYGGWSNAFFMPRPCMVKSNGTVDYYLDPNDYTKKLDGTASDIANAAYDGNAMMEWPLIWWKYEAGETEGEGYFYVSNVKVDNTYNCYCNINCDNQIVEHFYTAIYNGTGTTKLRSISGVALTSANGNGGTTYSQESTRALANNTTAKTEWFIDVWADRMLINGLLILMGKSLNSQATFGRGLDAGAQAAKEAYVTGTLNDKGLFWGSTSSGTYGVKVFGMENWYSCAYHRTAGLIGLANGNTAYKMTYGTADGTTANGYNTTGDGYHINTVARPANNYIKSCKFGDFGYLPLSTTGGSTSTYYTDYWYTNNSALTFALVGGSSNFGSHDGVSFVILNTGAGNAFWNIAAALTLKPLAKQPYSPPLTPTDPPAPLPTINTYKGENTLSSAETVGEVTIKGKIKEAP